VDYLFPNFEEARLLTGKETLDEIADSFLDCGVKTVVGFVNGMVASHLLCHSGTINRHSLNGALLS
jgi:hypothetical protein